jgi:transposase
VTGEVVNVTTNSITVCRREEDASETFASYTLSPDDLEAFCLTLDADDHIAFEATGNSAWFRDQVVSCVGRVVVVNPAQFKVIRSSVKKTVRNDAAALALFLSKDMLPETRGKTQAEAELAYLAHTRDLLVKQRTRLLNKLHALFNRHGIKLKRESLGSKRALEAVDLGGCSACEAIELAVLRDQALVLTAALTKLDRDIEGIVKNFDGYEQLTSIKGADKLAAYFGIVPRVRQSNDTETHGQITKRGNALVRTTLVQCTLIALRYSPYLKNFYARIRERRGHGKAIIATARKLLTIIYDTLKNGWVFMGVQ